MEQQKRLPNEGFHHIECEIQISLAVNHWKFIGGVEQFTIRRGDRVGVSFEYMQLLICVTMHLAFTPNVLHHPSGGHMET